MILVSLSRIIQIAVLIVGLTANCFGQSAKTEPWAQNQLMPPAELAKIINEGKEQPLIFSIGFDAIIIGSIDIGAAKEEHSLKKFKQHLSKLPKDADIVIYCGCCPFGPCPNIRPAFNLLKDMNFTNYKLLSLQRNIKADWIDKGYPTIK